MQNIPFICDNQNVIVSNSLTIQATLLGLMATELDCPLVYMDTECVS